MENSKQAGWKKKTKPNNRTESRKYTQAHGLSTQEANQRQLNLIGAITKEGKTQ